MSLDATRIALDTALLAKYKNVHPIKFGGIDATDRLATGTDLFMQVFLVPGRAGQHAMGVESYQMQKQIGIYDIRIYDREENSNSRILRIIDEIKHDVFRPGKTFNNGNLTITYLKSAQPKPPKGWVVTLLMVGFRTIEIVDLT